mmetsp:Transcript_58527/g.154417  ORF Transcript_58527/g.154417 Transcript_58527/m.154417 type:complete len:799 (-) Transcript_58527:904-3300(-)
MQQREEEEATLEAARKLLDDHIAKISALPPVSFDRESARKQVLERHAVCKRPVGSPIYLPVVSEDSSRRTDSARLPATPAGAEEKRRRERVKALKFFARIVVNGRVLKRADGLTPLNISFKQLCKDFDFSLQACDVVQLVSSSELPKVSVQIFEDGLLSPSEVANVMLPPSYDFLDEKADPISFQGPKPWTSPLAPVLSNPAGREVLVRHHYFSGEMDICVHGSAPAAQGLPSWDHPKAAKRTLFLSAAKLKSMIKYNQIDPNDPDNAHLVELLGSNKEMDGEQLTWDPSKLDLALGDSIRFVSRDGSTCVDSKKKFYGQQHPSCPASIRHKILSARERGFVLSSVPAPEKRVPLLEAEVEDGLWDEFFDKVYPLDFPADDQPKRAVENRKDRIERFRSKIRSRFNKTRASECDETKRKCKLREIVHQPELPELRPIAIMDAIRHLFRKRATLRPEQTRNRVAERKPTHCFIRITVQRAYDLPLREAQTELECIVKARFQGHDVSTSVFKGNSPSWNSHLVLPVQPPNQDWNPENLQKISDYLILDIFDTKIWEKSDGRSDKRKEERIWLGCVKIPFFTILTYSLDRLDGHFELEYDARPIGYVAHHPRKHDHKAAAAPIRSPLGALQFCVSLDPPLQPPPSSQGPVKERLDDAVLDARVLAWIKECKAPMHCSHRVYDALARCMKRDWVLATRYVSPCIPPPDAFDPNANIDVQMHQLCRFVSLIPFFEDRELEESKEGEVPTVWCTSKEFVVDMGAGDWEEHATLLCNFFLHLKVDAFLLFGTGDRSCPMLFCCVD